MTDTSAQGTQQADERLQVGWGGPTIVLDAADPDSWGQGIAAALERGHVLVINCTGVTVAQALAGHLHQFGAGVGCDVATVVHRFVTDFCPTGAQLRAVFTEQHAKPVPQRPRLRIVQDPEPAPK